MTNFGGGRPGGRKKGTPNKSVGEMRERIEEGLLEGKTVPEVLVEWALELKGAGDSSNAVNAMGKAAGYLYASLKAIEHSGEIATMPTLNIIVESDKLPAPIATPLLDGDHG